MDDELIQVCGLVTRVACRRMTPRYLKALSDSVEQACGRPPRIAWDRTAMAHAEIVSLLADSAADPVLVLLARSVPGQLHDLMVTAGPAAGGMITSSRRRLVALLRARDADGAGREMACCAIEMMQTGGPRYDLARFGMEKTGSTPREADLMIVAGRLSQKMAPVARQVYDQMPCPKWVISMGVCASSGGMFNNYAIVQGVDHIIPVDIYLPGCPPRPEMLMDAIIKLHDKIMNAKLGSNRDREITELEQARLAMLPLHVRSCS